MSTNALSQKVSSEITQKRLLRVLIVDDEQIARSVLRNHLESMADVEVVGEADSFDLKDKVERLKPSVLLLDIEMPGQSGLQLLDALQCDPFPFVVFVTAYSHHAVGAFDRGAVDYLMKPVRPDRLAKALDRVRKQLDVNPDVSPVAPTPEFGTPKAAQHPVGEVGTKILAKTGRGYLFLEPEDVLALQAEGELVWVITKNARFLATQRLREMEARLQHDGFIRIHRSSIVNKRHIKRLQPISTRRWSIELGNGQFFDVSKRQAQTIRRELILA